MGLIQQKRRVEQLAALADAHAQKMHTLQRQMRDWITSCLGTPEFLAWSFAGGAWLAAGRQSRSESDFRTPNPDHGRQCIFTPLAIVGPENIRAGANTATKAVMVKPMRISSHSIFQSATNCGGLKGSSPHCSPNTPAPVEILLLRVSFLLVAAGWI